jgi:ATP-dependent Clp protease ATP-binding subunit ClpB
MTPGARRLLAEEGYDPAFGARPLKRAIQRLIQNPLALQILEGRFQEGDHILVKEGEGGTFVFERAEAGSRTPAEAPEPAGV